MHTPPALTDQPAASIKRTGRRRAQHCPKHKEHAEAVYPNIFDHIGQQRRNRQQTGDRSRRRPCARQPPRRPGIPKAKQHIQHAYHHIARRDIPIPKGGKIGGAAKGMYAQRDQHSYRSILLCHRASSSGASVFAKSPGHSRGIVFRRSRYAFSAQTGQNAKLVFTRQIFCAYSATERSDAKRPELAMFISDI